MKMYVYIICKINAILSYSKLVIHCTHKVSGLGVSSNLIGSLHVPLANEHNIFTPYWVNNV